MKLTTIQKYFEIEKKNKRKLNKALIKMLEINSIVKMKFLYLKTIDEIKQV